MTINIHTGLADDLDLSTVTISSASLAACGTPSVYTISTGLNLSCGSKISDNIGSAVWSSTPNFNGMEVKGDIKMNGKSITDRLEKIEQHLGIVQRNVALEAKWERLKTLGDEYRAMEADILEKEKIWEIIKR